MPTILENLTLNSIEETFGKDLLRQGMAFYDDSAVIDLGYEKDESFLWGIIQDRMQEYKAQVKFEPDRIMIMCECGKVQPGHPCAHVVTLLILMAINREVLLGEEEAVSRLLDEAVQQPFTPTVEIHGQDVLTPEATIEDYRKRLEPLPVGEMRTLASRRGIKVSGQRREGILTALAAGLAEPENLAAAIGKLSSEARLVMDLMLIVGEDLERYYIDNVYQWLEGTLSGRVPGQRLEEIVIDLINVGLVFTSEVHLMLPLAVRAFRDQNPDLIKLYQEPVEPVEKTKPGDFGRLALWLLLLSQAGALESSVQPKTNDYGAWPAGNKEEKNSREIVVGSLETCLKPEILRRLEVIVGQPAIKIDYVARLLVQAGMWNPKSPQKMTPAFSHWLEINAEKQSFELVAAVKSLEDPVELDLARQMGDFKVKRDAYLRLPYPFFCQGLRKARQTFYRALQSLPAGVWFDIEAMMKLMHGLVPDFIPENNNSRQLWFELKEGPVKTANFESWNRSIGLYFQAILGGPALWMGMCDVLMQDGKPAAFSLTPFGEYLLGNPGQDHFERQPFDSPSIAFKSDDQIELNPVQASPEIISLILLIGKIETSRSTLSQKEPVGTLIYRVLNEGLGRIFASGWNAEKLEQALSSAAKAQLPKALAERIETCSERYGRLHIYSDMALIQFGDDYCLPELMAGTHLGQSLLYQFTPRLIAVRPENVQDILNELRLKGYTPRTVEPTHD